MLGRWDDRPSDPAYYYIWSIWSELVEPLLCNASSQDQLCITLFGLTPLFKQWNLLRYCWMAPWVSNAWVFLEFLEVYLYVKYNYAFDGPFVQKLQFFLSFFPRSSQGWCCLHPREAAPGTEFKADLPHTGRPNPSFRMVQGKSHTPWVIVLSFVRYFDRKLTYISFNAECLL